MPTNEEILDNATRLTTSKDPVIYTKPEMSGLTYDCTLTKACVDETSIPFRDGIILRRGKSRGYVLPWCEVVLHLAFLLKRSPKARADVAALLGELEGGDKPLVGDYRNQGRCHADRDGECSWAECPQLCEGEPAKSGRHCPLDASGGES